MKPNPKELFKPSTRGDIIDAIENNEVSKVAPSSPRPVEMLETCEITSDDKLTASDTALHELLVSTAYMVDPEMVQVSHSIPVSTVLKFFGLRDTHANRREHLKLSLKRLMVTTASYGTLSTRRYENVPMIVSWLESDETSDIIRFSLPQPIRELMKAMPEYAHLELAPLALMKSKFSIRIYRVLASAAVQKKWEPGAGNSIVLKATPNEIATWCGFPRDVKGDVAAGKLKERVLNNLEADLASIRRFRTKLVEVRKDVRGRPLDHIEFRLELQAPSHHQTRVLFDAAETNAGGYDADQFKVSDHIWLKAEKLFSKKLGFGHKQFFQLWQIAIMEATSKVAQTPDFETRSYRGERLLSAIEEMGADEAAWMMIAEEVGSPDLAHADAFVAFLMSAEAAEEARQGRITDTQDTLKVEVGQGAVPSVAGNDSLVGKSQIILTACSELNANDVDEHISMPLISAVLGSDDDPKFDVTIKHMVNGEQVSFGLRPRHINQHDWNCFINSIAKFIDDKEYI